MKIRRIKFAAFLILLLLNVAAAQTGGDFAVTQSVIGSGGGQNSNGGTFAVDGTIGQPVAGENSAGGAFAVGGGFWTVEFAPTAAAAFVSGRVISPRGNGIRNVVVRMVDQNGEERVKLTGAEGRFRFDDVPIGATYVFSIRSQRSFFSQPTLIRSIVGDVEDIVFITDY